MLSKEEIDYLFLFCRRHFVEYYDVQVELVDHLANAVEAQMQKDAKLSFEKAVEKVHKDFGVMGFAPLVAEKQKLAEKQSRKLFWKLFKEQFKWPAIATFFLLMASFLTIFSAAIFLIKWFVLVFVFFSLIVHFYTMFGLQQITKKSDKKFLIVNFSWFTSFSLAPAYLVNLPQFMSINFYDVTHPRLVIFGAAILLSLFILKVIVMCQTVSSIKNMLQKTYPEVFSTAR